MAIVAVKSFGVDVHQGSVLIPLLLIVMLYSRNSEQTVHSCFCYCTKVSGDQG